MQLTETISKLQSFSVQEWINWIENEIYEIPNEQALPLVDISLDEKLIIIYKKSSSNFKARKNLIAACVSLLSQLAYTKTSPSGLYYLILFIGYCKPEAYSNQLELLFKREFLKEIEFNNVNLNHLLLNELINFISIENFDSFFFNKIDNGSDILTKLIGLRFFSRSETAEKYFSYLEKLLISERRNAESIELISSEIVESFSQFCYIRKDYCSLAKWVEYYFPKLELECKNFYLSLCQHISLWLHDSNSIIKNEKNECAIGLKKFVQTLILNKDNMPQYLNHSVIEGYSFHEFSYKSANLPSLESIFIELGNEVTKKSRDDIEISNMINTLSAQLSYRGMRDPAELKKLYFSFLN